MNRREANDRLRLFHQNYVERHEDEIAIMGELMTFNWRMQQFMTQKCAGRPDIIPRSIEIMIQKLERGLEVEDENEDILSPLDERFQQDDQDELVGFEAVFQEIEEFYRNDTDNEDSDQESNIDPDELDPSFRP